MKKSVLFFAVMIVFLAGFAIDSHADMRGKGRGREMPMCNKMHGMGPGMSGKYMGMERPMRGMGMMAMASNLGLDEKQTSEFRTLHIEMKKEHIKKKAEISIAELELGEMLAKDPVDMKTAEAKVKQIESLRSDLKMLHIRTHEKVKAMLSPEQRKKLDPYMCMGMGMGAGRGWGMGRGMGQMDWTGQDDGDGMSGPEDMDESDMPAESHAH